MDLRSDIPICRLKDRISLSLSLIMNRSTLMNYRARLILKSDIKRIADTEGDPAGSPASTTSKYTWYKRGLNYLFMVCLITYLADVVGITNRFTNGQSRICG